MQDEKLSNGRGKADVWKGLGAGLVGGLVASWTMNQFQAVWTKVAEGLEKPHGAQATQPTDGQSSGQEQNEESVDAATVKAARAVSEGILGHQLQESEKKA